MTIPNRAFPPSENAHKATDAAIPSPQELHQVVVDG
jgi:hypothetical protein